MRLAKVDWPHSVGGIVALLAMITCVLPNLIPSSLEIQVVVLGLELTWILDSLTGCWQDLRRTSGIWIGNAGSRVIALFYDEDELKVYSVLFYYSSIVSYLNGANVIGIHIASGNSYFYNRAGLQNPRGSGSNRLLVYR